MNPLWKQFRIYLFYLLFVLVAICAFLLWDGSGLSETFVGAGDDFSEFDTKMHDKVFDDSRLFTTDIDKAIQRGVIKNQSEKKKILDAGSGVGKHYKVLRERFPNAEVIGVDRSKNMMRTCRIKDPSGKFIEGDLENEKLFRPASFDYIFVMLDTLYHNKDKSGILKNLRKWLKPSGTLFIHIFDRARLDAGPAIQTQYYKNKTDGKKHALTYYDGFTHDARWEELDEECVEYIQKFILDDGSFKETKRKLYIPNKAETVKAIEDSGFRLTDVIDLTEIDIRDIELFCFSKS
jgi:SAM-dependent methyltransferase